jgi:hypothetical protein
MPPRTRKAPASVVGARRTEEADVLDPGPAAHVSAPQVSNRRRRKTGVAEVAPIERPTPPVEGASHPDEVPSKAQTRVRKIQRSFYVDVDVLEDARAAVTYLGAYVPEAGVQSLADLVNPGLAAMVKQLQDTYNDGKPFRRVSHMQVGRPPRR